jgi:hypothetical protein
MAFSVAGAVALAGVVHAQQPPSPITYDSKVTPWPSKPRSGPASPFAPTDTNFVPPPPPPPLPKAPIDVSKTANSDSMKTLYYKKDTNAPVKPSAAAEIARPLGASTQQPGNDQPKQKTVSPEGTTATDPLIPTPEKLFRLDSEKQFEQAVNAERRVDNERRAKLKNDPTIPEDKKRPLDMLDFPPHKTVPGGEGPYKERLFAQREEVIEPNFVLYRRLLFEDVNTERYGWTLGPLQPFASTWTFLGQAQYLPYRFFSFPCLRHDTGAGQCLPGDPVPSMIYPPGLSVTGALAQAGVTVALYAIIP